MGHDFTHRSHVPPSFISQHVNTQMNWKLCGVCDFNKNVIRGY